MVVALSVVERVSVTVCPSLPEEISSLLHAILVVDLNNPSRLQCKCDLFEYVCSELLNILRIIIVAPYVAMAAVSMTCQSLVAYLRHLDGSDPKVCNRNYISI